MTDLKPEDRALILKTLGLETAEEAVGQDIFTTDEVVSLIQAARAEGPRSPSGGGEEDCPNQNGCEYCAEFGCPRGSGIVITQASGPTGEVGGVAWRVGDVAYHTILGNRLKIVAPCEGWWTVECSDGSTCVVRPSHLVAAPPSREA